MKSIFTSVLIGGVVLSIVSSCTTVPKEPLASGEVRLLSIGVLGAGIDAEMPFTVNIFFEAVGKPQIKRVFFFVQGDPLDSFNLSDDSYFFLGTKRAFQVSLPGLNVGSHRLECFAEYIRDGEIQKTNVIFTQITPGTSQ